MVGLIFTVVFLVLRIGVMLMFNHSEMLLHFP